MILDVGTKTSFVVHGWFHPCDQISVVSRPKSASGRPAVDIWTPRSTSLGPQNWHLLGLSPSATVRDHRAANLLPVV